MKTKLIHFIVLSGLILCVLPSAAQILLVKTGALSDTGNKASYTLSFDAGNGGTADKLIVSAGTESGSAAQITSITYNGVAMTLIPNTGGISLRIRGIWYLDNPFSGGAADIVVTGTATVFSHMRLGVASISGSAPGAAIGSVAGAASVSLNVPADGSFVFAAHASDQTTATTANSPLTQIFSTASDSANMAAGYANSVAAGPATYSFTNTLEPRTSAAAFVPAGTAPVLAGVSPADNATNVAIGANLAATFSNPVLAGTGNIELRKTADDSLVESFNAASSPQLTFSGQTLTIHPTSNLTTGVEYYVLIPATAVANTTGSAAFAGISDPTLWNFSADNTPPALATLSPVDGAGLVSDSINLVATFSESVAVNTGSIELWKAGGGSPVESFDVASSPQLTISGATLTINPTASLDYSADYYVMIPSTAVKDLSGNWFSGLTVSTAWNFTTGNPPAALTVLNRATFSDTTTRTAPYTYPTTTTDFDPDDTADALVLMLATEGSSPSATVSFGSQTMTQVIMNGNNPVGIYYLNNPSTSPQPVSVTINAGSGGSISGMGFTIFALNNRDNLGIVPTSIVNNFTSQTPLSIDISVPDTGSFLVAGYNNGSGSGSLSVNAPLTSLHAGDFGSLIGAFGYEENVTGGTKTYGFTTGSVTDSHYSAAVAFVGVAAPASAFSSWISNPAFGLAVADQDRGDDPDGDGIANGVENFFGTNPGTFSQGLVVGAANPGAGTFTFTHPQNATPASDLTAGYSWSKDLASFLASGATDSAGTTVAFTTQADTPSPGITTVTATVTGTAASKLFVRVNATQP